MNDVIKKKKRESVTRKKKDKKTITIGNMIFWRVIFV